MPHDDPSVISSLMLDCGTAVGGDDGVVGTVVVKEHCMALSRKSRWEGVGEEEGTGMLKQPRAKGGGDSGYVDGRRVEIRERGSSWTLRITDIATRRPSIMLIADGNGGERL